MKRTAAAMILAMCLALCGCNAWMDSYVSVTPHLEESPSAGQEVVSASSYLELCQALADMVESGTESGIISVAAYEQTLVESNMKMAAAYIKVNNPIGAYAVESIEYELGTSGGQPAVAVSIAYIHDRAEILRIQQVRGMEEAESAIAGALDQCETSIVLLVDAFVKTDFIQLVEDYSNMHPETVMELPQVTVTIYPENGTSRVVDLKFTYQTSRDSLRSMQTMVRPVFDSAELYVAGDAVDNEKYSQLYSFLMERYEYQIETSITPAYSLLRHGVGDSKAFATVYAAMCRRAQLDCQVVSGTKAGESWFWNIICDDGVYYHVDLLECNAVGRFCERADSDMEGYVWDYSAYPPCGIIEEESETSLSDENSETNFSNEGY